MILETFRQALQNVWSNKLRTFLTMLGIIIGVMAVIVIVGLGNGMTRSMRDSFSAMGTSTLSIQIWGYGSRTATVDDLYNIVKKNPELLSSISPELDFSDNTPKVGTTRYRYGTSSIWTSQTTSRSASSAITSTVRPTAAMRWARPSSSARTSSASWAC